MTVKLASALPTSSDRNGLEHLARTLVDRPEDLHLVVAVVDTSKITTNIDTGDASPTIRVRDIEVVPADEEARVRAILDRLHDERTGYVPVFDPVTGEIKANQP